MKLSTTILFMLIYAVTAIAISNQPQFTIAQNATDTSNGQGVFELGKVLPEQVGWFIVLGLGLVFAVVISLEIKMEEKYLGVRESSEWFNTAGRVIKTGLTAAAIVSAWTWAATLLQ